MMMFREVIVISIIELVLISIGLSMDAFAVSLCYGIEMRVFNASKGVSIALIFTMFQAVMPLAGFYAVSCFESDIKSYDHWVAFFIIGYIGIKMIYNAFSSQTDVIYEFDFVSLLVLAIATSIYALALGVSFAALKANIVFSSLFIGAVTFFICLMGAAIGFKFGKKMKYKAELLGGVILFVTALKILFEHLEII